MKKDLIRKIKDYELGNMKSHNYEEFINELIQYCEEVDLICQL